MTIRKATKEDYNQIWDIFCVVIQTGDTYVFDPKTPKKDLKSHWFADYMQTFVVEDRGKVLGTYIIKPNHIGLGNHVANASYMIHPNAQGKGIGKLLCEHSLTLAKESGYLAIQFNMVISINVVAVNLWKKYGFKIIGTTPKGFRHQTLGLVDTYMMHRYL